MNAVHEHNHSLNRFAVIPTPLRLNAAPDYTGQGVTIAFLDSGFFPHADLVEPRNRIVAYQDLFDEQIELKATKSSQLWQWHGTQTTVVAAGSGYLSNGTYRGLASQAQLVLVKVSERGRISEDSIARGIEWVIENRQRYNIRVLNISLGGDEDIPCSKSVIDQAAERAIELGIVVVVAAGNSGAEGRHSIPPANSPSVITVGGYTDNNQLSGESLELYRSNFGATADGTVKPEVIAPAMWVAAPILPCTSEYDRAEALSQIAFAADYEVPLLARALSDIANFPKDLMLSDIEAVRAHVELSLSEYKIVATHYQHVDGTSFAAPIVSSIVAQMLEANPQLTPAAVKSTLISSADRLRNSAAVRQGFGVVNARQAVALARNERHLLTSSKYGPPRVVDGKLVFIYHNDTAETVSLAAEFNNWSVYATPLRKDSDGLWRVELRSPALGRYEYKFVIDGKRWIEDPSNGMRVNDNQGGLNSLLLVME